MAMPALMDVEKHAKTDANRVAQVVAVEGVKIIAKEAVIQLVQTAAETDVEVDVADHVMAYVKAVVAEYAPGVMEIAENNVLLVLKVVVVDA